MLAAIQDLDDGDQPTEAARVRLAEAVAVMRALMSGSLQALYEELPLAEAIRDVAAAVSASTQCTVSVDPSLEHRHEPTLQLVARELVVNVAKHARASRLHVEVTRVAELARLQVVDDGVGIELGAARAEGHMGIALAEARIAAVGGRISYSSNPGGGTRVSVSLPLAWPADRVLT